jgi:hypothetical protein
LNGRAIFPGVEKHGRFVPVDIREFESGDFAGAQAMMGQEKNHGVVPFFHQRGSAKAVQEGLDFAPGNVFGPAIGAVAVRRDHISGQIMRVFLVEEEKPEKGAQSRDDVPYRPEADAAGEALEIIIHGRDGDVRQALDSAVFKKSPEPNEVPISAGKCGVFEPAMIAAKGDVLIEKHIGNNSAVGARDGLAEGETNLLKSKGQEAFDLIAVVPAIDGRHTVLVLPAEGALHMAEISMQKSRGHVLPGAFFVGEPLIEVAVFKTDSPESPPVVPLIQETLQIKLPIGRPAREQVIERFSRLIEDLAKRSSVSGISPGIREPRERNVNGRIGGQQAMLYGIPAEVAQMKQGAPHRLPLKSLQNIGVEIVVGNDGREIGQRKSLRHQPSKKIAKVITGGAPGRRGLAERFQMIGVSPDEVFVHTGDLSKEEWASRINDIVAVGTYRRKKRRMDSKISGGMDATSASERKGSALNRAPKRFGQIVMGKADGSGMKPLAKFATPKVKRQRGQVMVFARQAVIAESLRNGIEGQGLQPIERSLNDFFGVAMELDDEGRDQGKRMTTPGTEQAADRKRIRVYQGDQPADIAAMPAQTGLSLADPALRRFGKPLFPKRPQIITDLRFEQRDTVGSLSKAGNDWRFRNLCAA